MRTLTKNVYWAGLPPQPCGRCGTPVDSVLHWDKFRRLWVCEQCIVDELDEDKAQREASRS